MSARQNVRDGRANVRGQSEGGRIERAKKGTMSLPHHVDCVTIDRSIQTSLLNQGPEKCSQRGGAAVENDDYNFYVRLPNQIVFI